MCYVGACWACCSLSSVISTRFHLTGGRGSVSQRFSVSVCVMETTTHGGCFGSADPAISQQTVTNEVFGENAAVRVEPTHTLLWRGEGGGGGGEKIQAGSALSW